MIAGLRPEHFEDASIAGEHPHGLRFKAKIDVLESMGSEYYAYFNLESEAVTSTELQELAEDAGGADLPQSRGGSQMVARLNADSNVRQGQEADLSYDTERLQLFDPENGRSLLASDGTGQPTTPSSPPAV